MLQDDSSPVSEGTWVKDSNAQGGWRWVAGEVRQVVQSEATQNDPYARAYMAQPQPSSDSPPYQVLQDVPPEPPSPENYRDMEHLPVKPDLPGDGMFPYDSDDEPAQVSSHLGMRMHISWTWPLADTWRVRVMGTYPHIPIPNQVNTSSL